jgi:hypothetical protein
MQFRPDRLRRPRPEALRPSPEDSGWPHRVQSATTALRNQHPVLSAAFGLWPWQKAVLGLCLALLVFGIASLRASILPVLMALTIVPFACVIALRALTLWPILRPCTPDSASPQKPLDDDLPAYTALVPLNRESAVIPQLMRALKRLDYPAGKLEILLIIEDGDQETSNALAGAELAPNMRTVTVPSGAPRTKPRALNYALQESSGDYIVVYDAEDVCNTLACPSPSAARQITSRAAC